MKSRIILANLIDYFIGVLASLYVGIRFVDEVDTYMNSYMNGELVITNSEFTKTVNLMYLQTFYIMVLAFFCITIFHKTLTSLFSHGYTLGRWLQSIKVVDEHGYNLTILETLSREILFNGLFSIITLLIWDIIDMILLLRNKITLTSRFSKTMYIDKREEKKWDYLLAEKKE